MANKIAFNKSLNVDSIRIKVENSTELLKNEAKLIEVFNTYGIILIEYAKTENPSQRLLSLTKIFGSVSQHDRAEPNGIATIAVSEKYPGYLGTSNLKHDLHTDGTYSNEPPKVIAIQCLVPAAVGGLTLLASGKGLYEWIERFYPNSLMELFKPNLMSVKRDKKSATKPLFNKDGDNIVVTYRNDSTVKFLSTPCAETALELVSNYLNSSANILTFKMHENQVFIIDNQSVLHGRTSFSKSDKRTMQRIHFEGKNLLHKQFEFGFKG